MNNITCMSFNVLTWNKDYSKYCLTEDIRRPAVAEMLLRYQPDLLGIQEADNVLSFWADYLSAMLQQTGIYRCLKLEDEDFYKIYHGDSTTPVQFCSSGLMIFYKRDRFELIGHGGAEYREVDDQGRFYQWARLRDKQTGETVIMTNTHWSIDRTADGQTSEQAGIKQRASEAEELLRFWKENVGCDNLLFGTGDYNSYLNSECINIARSGLYKDASDVCDGEKEDKIDNCFINPARQKVEDCRLLKDTYIYEGKETRYSDHDAFWTEISYK